MQKFTNQYCMTNNFKRENIQLALRNESCGISYNREEQSEICLRLNTPFSQILRSTYTGPTLKYRKIKISEMRFPFEEIQNVVFKY